MIESLHDLLLFIIVAISAFVLGLLGYVCFRYRANRNQVASRRTHNSVLEIAWTAIPVLILVVIAIPSFKLLYFMDRAANPEMTLKAIGHQWYWSYEYPGQRQLHLRCLHDRRSGPPGRSAAPARRSTTGWCCRSTPTCGCWSPRPT